MFGSSKSARCIHFPTQEQVAGARWKVLKEFSRLPAQSRRPLYEPAASAFVDGCGTVAQPKVRMARIRNVANNSENGGNYLGETKH